MPNGHNKNFVRLCAAVEGFRSRYGQWPARVRIFPATLENLRSLFTPADFEKLTAKVQLIPAEAPFIAEDDAGNSYNYGADGAPKRDGEALTPAWLGVTPIAHD
jgi:hypothetical protein